MFIALFSCLILFADVACASSSNDLWTSEEQNQETTVMDLPVTVKESVFVDGEHILLGDIFAGVSEKEAKIKLAKAPALGQNAVLTAAWLNEAAKKNGLDFKASENDKVTVERNAKELTADDIAVFLREALADKNFPEDGEIVFNRKTLHYLVPKSEKNPVSFENPEYDPDTARVSGTLIISYDGKQHAKTPVSGKAVFYVEVPSAAGFLSAGDILQEKDIVMKKIPFEQKGENHADLKSLVGKQLKRAVRAGQTLETSNVRAAVVIEKGKLINLLYEQGGLSLKMQGKSLENGAVGEVVRFQNPQSKTIVEGEIIDAQTARVIGKK